MLCLCSGFVYERLQFAPLPATSRLPVSSLTLSYPGLAPKDPGHVQSHSGIVQRQLGHANTLSGNENKESEIAPDHPVDANPGPGHVFSCSGQIFLQQVK